MTQQPHTLPIEDRLRATVQTVNWRGKFFPELVNPDGPKAADIIAALYGALEPFGRLAVADDFLAGMDPDQFRQNVADARAALSLARGEGL